MRMVCDELGVASQSEVGDRLDQLAAYVLKTDRRVNGVSLCPNCRLRTEWPELVYALERLNGPMPTLFGSDGCYAAVTRSGLMVGEPQWAPITALQVFGLSDSFLRRLCRTGRITSFKPVIGHHVIHIQSLRDYCDRSQA